MFRCLSTHFITLRWSENHNIIRCSSCPRDGSSDCFTSALANLIALAGNLSFSGLSGSGRVWVVKNDEDLTGLKNRTLEYWYYQQSCLNKPCVKSNRSCEVNFMDL